MVNYNTITELIKHRAELGGDRRFATEIKTGECITYKQLYERVCLIECKLRKIGVKKGDKIAIIMENSLDFMMVFYGIIKLEAVPIPINYALKIREMKYIIEDAGIELIITNKECMKNIFCEFVVSKRKVTENIIALESSRYKQDYPEMEKGTALILYTSGSTGNSKGVMLTHDNLLAEMNNIMVAHKLMNNDRVLCVLPWFHINGLVITMLTPLLAENEIYIAEKFSVSSFWQWIDKYKITWFSGVPTIYSYLLSKDTKAESDISSLRFARSASASLPVKVLNEFEKRYNVTIIESYGITEGGSQLTSNPLPPQHTKPGSVGLPYGIEVIIADDNNNEMAQGQVGEVYVRGASISHGYYGKTDETKASFWNGWFKTGDMGRKDEDGYLYLEGRKKELINRAGEKFSPREIDEILYKIDGVELACAVGVPHKVYGEEVIAFIKKKVDANIAESDIIEYCKDKMVSFKVPKKVYFVDEFPQGGNGKIQRLKFIEMYEMIRKDD